jgi:hypothetical protein
MVIINVRDILYIEVILLVEPASKFNHLYVRNGKIIGALAMSIQFVVVIGNYSYN